MQLNLTIYEEIINIILDSKNENKFTKKKKIKNLKSKRIINIIEKTVKIYKETNAMLRWNLIKKEIENMLEKEKTLQITTLEEKNTVVNKLMTVIQLYVDKENHEKRKEKTENIKNTKLLF